MIRHLLIASSLIAMTALPAAASSTNKSSATTGADCTMNYALFEQAIPHVDLASCPASLGFSADDHVFCRASAGADLLTVYAFEEGGFQCLKALRSYEPPEFEITVH